MHSDPFRYQNCFTAIPSPPNWTLPSLSPPSIRTHLLLRSLKEVEPPLTSASVRFSPPIAALLARPLPYPALPTSTSGPPSSISTLR